MYSYINTGIFPLEKVKSMVDLQVRSSRLGLSVGGTIKMTVIVQSQSVIVSFSFDCKAIC